MVRVRVVMVWVVVLWVVVVRVVVVRVVVVRDRGAEGHPLRQQSMPKAPDLASVCDKLGVTMRCTHSLTHSLAYSLTHSLTHSLSHFSKLAPEIN